jgi:Ulp1 family protease
LQSLLEKGTSYKSAGPLVKRFETAPDDFSPYLDLSVGAQKRLASPTGWLNDECVNSLTALIQRRLIESDPTCNADNCAVFNTAVFTLVEKNAIDDTLWKSARRSCYWKRRFWIIPINKNNHWVVAVLKLMEGTVYLYDSFGCEYGTFSEDVLKVCLKFHG